LGCVQVRVGSTLVSSLVSSWARVYYVEGVVVQERPVKEERPFEVGVGVVRP